MQMQITNLPFFMGLLPQPLFEWFRFGEHIKLALKYVNINPSKTKLTELIKQITQNILIKKEIGQRLTDRDTDLFF